MRVYYYDAYEFDSPHSEETLHAVIAHKKECPSAQSFLEKSKSERFRWRPHDVDEKARAKSSRHPTRRMQAYSPVDAYDPVPLPQHPSARELREHAKRFNCFPEPLENLTVIAEMHTSSIVPLSTELLLETQRQFIWYMWWTTA